MKRLSGWFFTISLILCLMVTGCSKDSGNGGKGTKDDPVKITYLDNIPSPERTALLKEMIAKFEEKNPGIKVEYSSVGFEESYKKLMAMGASGTLPDVFNVDESMFTSMASAGYLQDLQSNYDKWDQKDKLIKAVEKWPSKYKGHFYAIPDAFMLQALFIRSDWFHEKGLTPRIDTWDQYFEYGKKLTDPSKGQYGISFRGGPNGVVRFMEYLASLTETPGWFDENGKPITSKPEALEAFKKFYGVYKNGYAPKESINWGYKEMVQGFLNGQAGILNQTAEVIIPVEKDMKKGTYEIIPIPKSPSGKNFNHFGSTAAYAISSKSKQKEAAWEFIEFMSSPEMNLEYSKRNGMLPIYTESYKDPFFSEGAIKGFAEQMADPEIVYVNWADYLKEQSQFIGTYAVEQVQNYLLNKQSAEETLKNLNDFLEKAQQRYEKEEGK
ncbi:multiple sugar transport system substrate-binding protein [Bacillus sp. SLBN-46]|uniref:ABC transporter substrate-binding protein n=1 Tax=Bacillus sp. SLBN-46 TaxID=3042283 RepID=UPI002862BAF2|nr:sugar ABC transporter substrate-binding protein [Bacillus sp. SLBN-46]MDR6123105.1 multiple sugar transport system substrate-binding protein [Bacillus sp. SLBN-46]